MKNNIFVKIFLLAVMGLIGECAFAQGLIVVKNDGTEIRIPQQELNYVTVYDEALPNLPDIKPEVSGVYYGVSSYNVGGNMKVDSTCYSKVISGEGNTVKIHIPQSIGASQERSMASPSFWIEGLQLQDMGNGVKSFQAKDLTSQMTNGDGGTITINIYSISGQIDMNKGLLSYETTVKPGKMPMNITYTFEGYKETSANFPQQGEASTVFPVKLEKRLKGLVRTEYESWPSTTKDVTRHTYKFQYDSNNRLVKADRFSGDPQFDSPNSYYYKYTWTGNQVITEEDMTSEIYTFERGKVQKIVNAHSTMNRKSFFFDNTNHPVSFFDDSPYENRKIDVVWTGNKISSVVENFEDWHLFQYTYVYGNEKTKGYCPFFCTTFVDDPLMLVHPDFMGELTTDLPTKITYDESSRPGEIVFEYEYDENGYVTKCTGTDTWEEEIGQGQVETVIVRTVEEYVWE